MRKTKTLNARASHFSGGSATALFGKILCCQRKSNLVNLDHLPMPAIVTVASNSIQISSLLIAFPKY